MGAVSPTFFAVRVSKLSTSFWDSWACSAATARALLSTVGEMTESGEALVVWRRTKAADLAGKEECRRHRRQIQPAAAFMAEGRKEN